MTVDNRTLSERLMTMFSHRGDGIPTQYVNPDGPEAQARIAELEAALRPFAEKARQIDESPFYERRQHSDGYTVAIRLGDCREARRALRKTPPIKGNR